MLRRCDAREFAERHAGRADAKPRLRCGQFFQKIAQGGVFQLAFERAGRVLQRLYAVEHEQAAAGAQGFDECEGAFAGVGGRVFDAEKGVGAAEKWVGRTLALVARALTVKRKSENSVGLLAQRGQAVEQPPGDEGGFARAAGGDEFEEIGGGVLPAGVEQVEFFGAAYEVGVEDGEVGNFDLLRLRRFFSQKIRAFAKFGLVRMSENGFQQNFKLRFKSLIFPKIRACPAFHKKRNGVRVVSTPMQGDEFLAQPIVVNLGGDDHAFVAHAFFAPVGFGFVFFSQNNQNLIRRGNGLLHEMEKVRSGRTVVSV